MAWSKQPDSRAAFRASRSNRKTSGAVAADDATPHLEATRCYSPTGETGPKREQPYRCIEALSLTELLHIEPPSRPGGLKPDNAAPPCECGWFRRDVWEFNEATETPAIEIQNHVTHHDRSDAPAHTGGCNRGEQDCRCYERHKSAAAEPAMSRVGRGERTLVGRDSPTTSCSCSERQL